MPNEAKEKGFEKLEDILAIEANIKAAEDYKPKRTMANLRGRPFYRMRIRNGRPYWYLCQNYYDWIAKKWKQKTRYLGTRKPRSVAPGEF